MSLDIESEVTAFHQHRLPSIQLENTWDSLIFDNDIKHRLLRYMQTSVLFSRYSIDSNLITWNRVILLHGEPGTGKTTLCKALAQKISIRLAQDEFEKCYLVEINANSIFSKWFSESGKQLTRMFDSIRQLLSTPKSFVFVLIDEVESLAAARSASMRGNEPADAIRVVNSLLTELDKLSECRNVLVLATSNLSQAIDVAFIDRADIKQYIGAPSCKARYAILSSSIMELSRKGLVCLPSGGLASVNSVSMFAGCTTNASNDGLKLWSVCQEIKDGTSGRILRKLPFIAFSKCTQRPPVSFDEYLLHLKQAVEDRTESSD